MGKPEIVGSPKYIWTFKNRAEAEFTVCAPNKWEALDKVRNAIQKEDGLQVSEIDLRLIAMEEC